MSTRTSLASRNSRVGTCARSLWWFGALLPLFAFAAPAYGYNCGGREFRLVAVSVWPAEAGASADYSIVAQMPGLSGCEILVDTVITIQFPGDTDTSTVSGGILNGATIAKWVARSGPFLSFRSPIEVDSSGLLSLQVWGVTNDSTPGTKTLTMSASPVRSGRIGATTSSLFTLRPPWWAPVPTPTPTSPPGPCSLPSTTNSCIPGGGKRTSNCMFEWLPSAAVPRDFSGQPRNRIVCYEGDPRCDADPDLGNAVCMVAVQACINNRDPRLPECAPTNVVAARVRQPNPHHLRDASDARNLDQIEYHLGLGGLGLTVWRTNAPAFLGTANPLPDVCSPAFLVEVPLRNSSKGLKRTRKRFDVKVFNSFGDTDRNLLEIECRPSTCGDGVVQPDHETCDDGNRINGDGCDQACQRERPSTATSTPTATRTPASTPMPSCAPMRPAPVGPAVYVEDLHLSAPGEATVSVRLATGGAEIAGVRNDILFDDNVRIRANFLGRPDCAVNPGIDKGSTSFAFLPPSCSGNLCTGSRAIVFSVDNVAPIPDGALLYTCGISVSGTGGVLNVANARASDPNGGLVPNFYGREGVVCVSNLQTPPSATPTRTGTPTPTRTHSGTPRPTRTPTPPTGAVICGNGIVEGDEECDDGGICLGTSKAGQSCASDDDCYGVTDEYSGVCQGGEKAYTLCHSNEDCPGGTCLACWTFGGDGCAANCTTETIVDYQLVPGVVRPDQTCEPGTSCAVVWGDPLVIGLRLRGSQQLKIGKERAGQVPVVVPVASVQFDQIPISTLACACIRAAEYKTCGGGIFLPDGTFAESCTSGFASWPQPCPANRPCTSAFGPGNAASGVMGCESLDNLNVDTTQNSCPEAGEPGGPVQLTLSGIGGPGSMLVASAMSIGISIGACQPTFCTDLDPLISRGVPYPFLLTTGQACATVLCKNDDPGYPATPRCVLGQTVSCANLIAGNITGLTLGGAFTALGQLTLGDIEVTTTFVAQ